LWRVPTVLRTRSYRLFFFSGDRKEPAHVHVRRGWRTGKVWLTPVAVARSGDFRASELRVILRIVRENHSLLLGSWDEYFETRG
jgi:hypothetical protein